MHSILTYKTVDRFNDRKMRFRGAHLKLVQEYFDRGELIMGGSLLEPNDSAVMIFNCENLELVRQFVEKDPYYTNGLVKSYNIRIWSVAIGA